MTKRFWNAVLTCHKFARLAHKPGTLGQFWKEMTVMGVEISKNIFVAAQFEVFTTDFHRDDFFTFIQFASS
jgi:hypothetical protein